MMQWIMKVWLFATGSELLPAFGHLSFYLIHSKTRHPHHLKVHQQFQCFFTLFLGENHKHKSRGIFSASTSATWTINLHRHLIILRIYWVAASKSVSTGINLFDFTAQYYSVARSFLPSLLLCYLEICLKTMVP